MSATRPRKVPLKLARPRALEPKAAETRSLKIQAVNAAHYARLALINSECERKTSLVRLEAQELRRVENARYRKELEEARAA